LKERNPDNQKPEKDSNLERDKNIIMEINYNMNDFLEAGVHFGHNSSKWNPHMAPYIFMEHNGIHLIDVKKTINKLQIAALAAKNIAKSGRKILFVATK
jgi:small subunit ribosomal protein S2